MNKIISITALLLSAHIPHTLSQGEKESWTTATLSHGEWELPANINWSPKQLSLISEASKALNNVTVHYKNEEHTVTVSLAGLSAATSVETKNSKFAHIKIPNGFISIGLGDDLFSGLINDHATKNYIYITRGIEVPKEEKNAVFAEPLSKQQFETLRKTEHLDVPVIKKFDHYHNVMRADTRQAISWNILSVSAERRHDTVTITFTIDPTTFTQYWDWGQWW
jgi:hypothetical protein